ncbi:MAG TPA: hypothetical protein VNY73_03275 [Bacteroidia bacterium]|nr:hypothetical protein [Bacteroidia bacterium]
MDKERKNIDLLRTEEVNEILSPVPVRRIRVFGLCILFFLIFIVCFFSYLEYPLYVNEEVIVEQDKVLPGNNFFTGKIFSTDARLRNAKKNQNVSIKLESYSTYKQQSLNGKIVNIRSKGEMVILEIEIATRESIKENKCSNGNQVLYKGRTDIYIGKKTLLEIIWNRIRVL